MAPAEAGRFSRIRVRTRRAAVEEKPAAAPVIVRHGVKILAESRAAAPDAGQVAAVAAVAVKDPKEVAAAASDPLALGA